MWGDDGGAASLAPDGVVLVWGYTDPDTGAIAATRIKFTAYDAVNGLYTPDPGVAPAVPPEGPIRLHKVNVPGVISEVRAAEGTTVIGTTVIDVRAAIFDATRVVVGAVVRVRGATAYAGAKVEATAVDVISSAAPQPTDLAVIDGRVYRIGAANTFWVNGFPVDATNATVTGGTLAWIRRGTQVQ